jgi:hypothetical protein
LATVLIGSDAIGRQQIEVGKISDLLVDPTGIKPVFAREAGYAIPVQMLRPIPGHKVVINVTQQDFTHAQSFQEGFSPNSTNQIYRYER